ncbi:HK97-gp10 family putative phage morphogenesis protein [Candidatus Desulfosporosinus nitrosoreducens]|uniref:HK97-gp10 family putative phage morphogenesis protein n=1 Tax=Candidatus Desulfosporosinus nitrosoreducens TaxID=3401928 RepID=UPI00280B1605|nr:HK97-gp10 family putative phage morphogenesis protein [Desulfosporosinus sp. PR]
MAAEIELRGMDDLLARIEAMGRQGSSIGNAALKAAAQPVQQDASARAPRSSSPRLPGGKSQQWRTGQHLADNIRISGVKTKDGIKYVLVGIEKTDNSPYFYGKFLEWGTSKLAARPFLGPAYERNKEQVVEIIKQQLREALGL